MPIAANVMLAASVMVASGSSLAAAPGPAAFTTLKEGEVRHGFTARAIFSGLSGTPIGARFVHRTGTVADVLFFASVPQISISVRSIPVSDRGEPHALEHLVVRRGLSGAYLKMLLTMRLAVGAAATDRDTTYYQFRTSAGAEAFYELLAQHLTTLVKPDFTDEEVRREVANVEVVAAPDGRRTLLMKGAVYNEMVANMARPGYRQPRVLKQMVFGKDHPLALNAGGDPVQLLDLTPESVRAFHSAHYQIGPNLELVAALPLTWSADSFLKQLDALLTSLAPTQVAPGPRTLPPFRPAPRGEIRIGAYPSASADAPQDVLIGWQALPELTPDEWDAAEVLLQVIGGGEISYLHQDLVEEKTRSLDSGVTAVAAGLEYVTAAYPYVTFSGLPASALDTTYLEELRASVVKRCRWIAEIPDGSSELSELATRVRSRFAAARREYLKFVDSPPNFGQSGDRRWHDRLNRVVNSPGFMKSVAPLAHYERLDREMAAGRNPWRQLVLRAGLSDLPYVVALRPDPGLADREKKDTAARLRRYETQVAERLGGGDVQQALAALSAEQEAMTAELTARDQAAPKPRFVSDPPLTLDDVPFEQSRLATGVPLVRVHFDTTPFTDVAVAFDLSRVPPDEWILLPLLDAVLSGTGVTTREGEALDYAQARERREGQIYRFSIAPIGNAATRRHELEVAASAASVEEISRAVEWIENHTLRAGFGGNARARLIDACRKAIQAHRGVLERPEYEWSMDLAAAFEYQDDPLQLPLSSVFTKLRSITRLRWRLEDPSAEDRKRIYVELAGVEGLLANRAERAVVAAQLESLAGELGETLRYELSMLPPDRWHEDLLEVVRDLRADLDVGAARVLADFERLRRRVLVQRGARTRITASRANAELAAKLLDAFLAKLPEGSAATPPVYGSSSVQARLEQRYGRLSRPVHVGFVRPAATSGVHVVSASGPSYTSPSRTAVLDLLAVGVFAGRGPHSFYMRTTGAGLAFSNGIVAQRSRGRILYYAERCPDLVQTIKFVGDLAATHPTDDPFFMDYSLAYAFADDFRGANDFSSRGAALAQDLADGITPERVARFRRLLMETAREKDALVHIRERRPDAVGRVIVGYGRNVSAPPGASAFVIAPEELLTKYETFLKEQGEADRLVRVFPRDFWPRPGEVVKPREESAGGAMRNMEPRQ